MAENLFTSHALSRALRKPGSLSFSKKLSVRKSEINGTVGKGIQFSLNLHPYHIFIE